jgi:hypothetical protein
MALTIVDLWVTGTQQGTLHGGVEAIVPKLEMHSMVVFE